ncbi:caspase domain-containing protein [Gautieria morchelliformis]|nr:caspase domain-containing protein [Gautieria morchelliformis]
MPGSSETQFRAELSAAEGCTRALLISIDYSLRTGTEHSIHSHTHLSAIKDLTMKYGYTEAGIYVLSDDGNHTDPTRDNIIDALRNLVKDAKPGDRFFFYYCGHGGQIHNKDGRETDRKDELILPSDYIDTHQDGEDSYSVERYQNHILDDELNDILVKSLPVGSQLALLDCCNAGTMMDLEYYGPFSEGPIIGRRITEGDFRSESSDPMTDASPKAHVVSWSSSVDGQQSWQHPKTGGVMSEAFIESLADNKSPTYDELYHKLSEKLARASQEITNDKGKPIQQKPLIGLRNPSDITKVLRL